jgi:uncharacterized protein (DUF427 family)
VCRRSRGFLAMTIRATWNGAVIAESDNTVVVEGNHYFPIEDAEYLDDSRKHTVCPWKGEASCYTIVVGDRRNTHAAWYYPHPKAAASTIAGRVAFWRGVKVAPVTGDEDAPSGWRKLLRRSVA